MDIDKTIETWFSIIKPKLAGEKIYHDEVRFNVDKLCGWVVILVENYAQGVLLLLNQGKILPAKALLRVISDVSIKCIWCLKGFETSDDEFTRRFDRWRRSSLSEYKSLLARQLKTLENEYGKEVSGLKQELRKLISSIEVAGIGKETRLLITDDLIKDVWITQSGLNVEALYRRFHEAIHPDIVLFHKMSKVSNGKIIYKADIEESPEKIKGFCLSILGYLFEVICSINKWDDSPFDEDIKRLREKMKKRES